MTGMTGKDKSKIRLSEHAVFADIPEDTLVQIVRTAQHQVVPPGRIIVGQNDPGNSCYLIDSGRVRVFREGIDGMEYELTQLGPGDIFGELALLTGESRSASVQAIEETHLTVLPKDQFDRIVRDYPHVTAMLAQQISGWLLRSGSQLEVELERQFRPPRLSSLDFLLIIGLSVLFALVFNQSSPKGLRLFPETWPDEALAKVSPSEAFQEWERKKALLVDAMPSNFYEGRHIPGAVNLPMALFDFIYMMALSQENKAKRIIVYGRTISKRYDQQVAMKLVLRGHKSVQILEGGLSIWEKRGYPVEP
jgi:CRP-like cAMP-binding protein/rhodanese-related sulfurtransferase